MTFKLRRRFGGSLLLQAVLSPTAAFAASACARVSTARAPAPWIREYIGSFIGGEGPSRRERLYCKRPILCLVSSKILTPHPPHRPAIVYPPPPCLWCGGKTHSLGGKGVGGHDFGRRQALLCIYIRKYSVVPAKQGSSGPCLHCRKQGGRASTTLAWPG